MLLPEVPNANAVAGLESSHRAFRGASRLLSIAGWAPERRLMSTELSAVIQGAVNPVLFDLEGRTGIRERREAEPGLTPADLAEKAARLALERAELPAHAIDLILYCGVSREYVEPATATVLHHRLALRSAPAFDISNACLGFLDGWCVADAMIASGRVRHALVVCAELGTPYARIGAETIRSGGNAKTLFSSMTLGDGAAAAVLTSKHGYSPGLVCGVRESYGEHHDLCVLPALGQPMHTHPTQLFDAALGRVPAMFESLMRESGWRRDEIDCVIPHQVTVKHTFKGLASLGIAQDKVAITVDRFGNMGSASVPFTLAEAIEQGRAKPGSKVFVSGFGSGLGMAMLAVQL